MNVTVSLPEKTFPAPASVSVQDPDSNSNSYRRIIWKGVPYAESYVYYVKSFTNLIYFSAPIQANAYTRNTDDILFISVSKTLFNYTPSADSVGVCAVGANKLCVLPSGRKLRRSL